MSFAVPRTNYPVTSAADFHSLQGDINGVHVEVKATAQDTDSDGLQDYHQMYFTGQDGKHKYALTTQADNNYDQATYTLAECNADGSQKVLGKYATKNDLGSELIPQDVNGRPSLQITHATAKDPNAIVKDYDGIQLPDGTFVDLGERHAYFGNDVLRTDTTTGQIEETMYSDSIGNAGYGTERPTISDIFLHDTKGMATQSMEFASSPENLPEVKTPGPKSNGGEEIAPAPEKPNKKDGIFGWGWGPL